MDLEWIEAVAFCGIRDISTLVLSCNKLTSLPWLCSLECCRVNLHIANNNISRLSKYFFKGFKKIQIINMSRKNLHELPDLHRVQLSLVNLMVPGNKIQSLDALQTSGKYMRLNYVGVQKNDIRNFNISILHLMPKLDYLYLSVNKLSRIDDLQSLNMSNMNMKNNPWHCGAELSWMSEEDSSFERGLTCATSTCHTEWPSLPWVYEHFLRMSHTVYISWCIFVTQ